jgi:hypothetical protein
MNQDAIKVFTCPQLLQPVTSNVKVEIASWMVLLHQMMERECYKKVDKLLDLM